MTDGDGSTDPEPDSGTEPEPDGGDSPELDGGTDPEPDGGAVAGRTESAGSNDSGDDRLAPVPDRFRGLLSGIRFGKFVSVGAVGAAFDLTTLWILTTLAGLPAAVANLLSIEVAILVMFLINDGWTFAESREGTFLRRCLRSHLVRAGGSSVQYLLFVGVVYGLPISYSVWVIDWILLVKVGAIGVAMLVNYVFESLFTWRVHQGD